MVLFITTTVRTSNPTYMSCETWSLSLSLSRPPSKEYRLRVTQYRMQAKIFGTERGSKRMEQIETLRAS
jgi:hypothetical protein